MKTPSLAGKRIVVTRPREQAEGLVHELPRRGSIVAPLELHDLEEIQAVRAGIEGFAARLGAERVSAPDLASMNNLVTRLRETDADMDAYLALEWQLHETCYAAAQRPRLLRLVEDYRRPAERYVRAALHISSTFFDAVRFQEELVAACAANDGDRAELVIRSALDWTVEQVAPLLKNARPEPQG